MGSKLTHSKITTDYAENLLEFITGVHQSTSDLLSELEEIHAYTSKIISDEILWPMSLPSLLPEDEEIPIAYYGESNVGKLKTLYRLGLGHRYGRSMQSIAGLHYNFSLSDNFWNYAKNSQKNNSSIRDYKDEQYFKLIRNYRRYSWVLTYLFGASSVVHESFLRGKSHSLLPLTSDSFYTEYGTSLRMGGLGYTSNAQKNIAICYNKLNTYVSTLEKSRQESYPLYEKIGLKDGDKFKQLNTNLLQIDNEFYSTIRPKNIAKSKESALKALNERGIEYIEVRLLDIDFDSKLGTNETQIKFLHIFLLWCLSTDSPVISNEECEEIDSNFDKVVRLGRQDNLLLSKNGVEISINDFLNNIFMELKKFADIFENVDNSYSVAVSSEEKKIEDKNRLPSSKLIERVKKEGFLESLTKLAKSHKENFEISDETFTKFKSYAEQSHNSEKFLLDNDSMTFENFLNRYFEDIKI